MGLFSDLFTNRPARDAAAAYNSAVTQGRDQAFGALTEGRDAALGSLDAGRAGALAQIGRIGQVDLSGAQRGYSSLLDAMGANGADGLSRASTAFRSAPGYTAGLESGLDAIDRRAAARGMLASGATNLDTARYATDYADQQFGNYAQRLLAAFQGVPGMQLAQAQAQAAPAAQAYLTTGQQRAGIESGTGQNIAQIGFQAAQGMGNANAQAQMARGQAAQNVLGAINMGANLAGKLFGMMDFGGGGGAGFSGSSP